MKNLLNVFCLTFFLTLSQENYAQDSVVVAIDNLLSSELKSDVPGGVVLISKGDEIVYQKAFGMADMELNVPMKEDMVLCIGSNTKQITAVAILQLVEKGQLSLTDSLGKFVDCANPASAIRIEQLLSHTSGLSSNTDTPAYRLLSNKHENREEMVRYYASQPMEFPAGSKWRYNNANFYVLGFIIEKISGKPYEAYLDENIFKPAGMLHSYIANTDKLIPKRASGYINGRVGIINASSNDVTGWYASGGIMSTAEDMYRWNRACRSGILVKKETLEKAFVRQKLSDGTLASYGFGWHIQNLHGSTTHRHGGAVPGFIAETLYLPEEDVFVVMLLNSESKLPSTALTRMIAGLMIDKPYRFSEIKLSEKKQGSYQGSYRNGAGEVVNITEADGKVYFQRPGGNKYTIKPSTANEFFFDKDYLWVEFKEDSDGKINGLIFGHVGISEMIWKKLD